QTGFVLGIVVGFFLAVLIGVGAIFVITALGRPAEKTFTVVGNNVGKTGGGPVNPPPVNPPPLKPGPVNPHTAPVQGEPLTIEGKVVSLESGQVALAVHHIGNMVGGPFTIVAKGNAPANLKLNNGVLVCGRVAAIGEGGTTVWLEDCSFFVKHNIP